MDAITGQGLGLQEGNSLFFTIEGDGPIEKFLTGFRWLIWCLLGFQLFLLFHETGHLLMGVLVRAEIEQLHWFPLGMPSSLFSNSNLPSLILWGGIVGGSVTPLALFPLWKTSSFQVGRFLKFWAGLCLTATGVYLALGGHFPLTDSGQLLSLGWPHWFVILVGVFLSVTGYAWARRVIIEKPQTPPARAKAAQSSLVWLLVFSVCYVAQYVLATFMAR